jgi:hypothetical protein
MKLNQIKFRLFIEDLSIQDVFKCLGLIFIIILEKYPELDSLPFLKSWCSIMIIKANRRIIQVKKGAEQCQYKMIYNV